jgi:predicted transcriptional regulator
MRCIVRVQHDKDCPYLMVSKTTVQDTSISFEARGFLAFLLSKPDDWRIRPEELAKETKLNRATIYRLIKKLREAGYINRVDIIKRNDSGTIYTSTSIYTVYENKRDAKKDEVLDNVPF